MRIAFSFVVLVLGCVPHAEQRIEEQGCEIGVSHAGEECTSGSDASRDRDGDGVTDRADGCPSVPAPGTGTGCPPRDPDGS
jgi:hypothetical protein